MYATLIKIKSLTPSLRLLRVIHIILALIIVQWFSFRLNMAGDFNAIIAVFVLAQPQIGMIYSKATNRLLGTFIGCIMAIIFVLLFNQAPPLFFAALAFWVGLCAWLSAIIWRPFAYLFQISGFTLIIVALPSLLHGEPIILSAINRSFDNCLSFIVMIVLAVLLLPSLAQQSLKQQAKQSMSSVLTLLLNALTQNPEHKDYIKSYDQSIQKSLDLVETRINAYMESITNTGLLNSANGLIQSQLNTITQINLFAHQRLHLPTTSEHIGLNEFSSLLLQLEVALQQLLTLDDKPMTLVKYRQCLREQHYRFVQFNQNVTQNTHANAAQKDELIESKQSQEKLQQLCLLMINCLQQLILSCARLSIIDKDRYLTNVAQHPIAFHVFYRQALMRALRPAIATLIAGALWYLSGWTLGYALLFAPITYPLLFANTPNPKNLTISQFKGLAYGLILALISRFLLMPIIDGFTLFICIQLPALFLGSYFLTHASTFPKGINMLLTYYLLIGVAPTLQANDLVLFINTSLALIIGNIIAFSCLMFIFPENALRYRNSIYFQTYAEAADLIKKRNYHDNNTYAKFVSKVYDRLNYLGLWYRNKLIFLPLSRQLMQILSMTEILANIEFRPLLSHKTKENYDAIELKLNQWLQGSSYKRKPIPCHNLVNYFEQLNVQIADELLSLKNLNHEQKQLYQQQFMMFTLIPDLLKNSQLCQKQIEQLDCL